MISFGPKRRVRRREVEKRRQRRRLPVGGRGGDGDSEELAAAVAMGGGGGSNGATGRRGESMCERKKERKRIRKDSDKWLKLKNNTGIRWYNLKPVWLPLDKLSTVSLLDSTSPYWTKSG